jgi:hypothetical protein
VIFHKIEKEKCNSYTHKKQGNEINLKINLKNKIKKSLATQKKYKWKCVATNVEK